VFVSYIFSPLGGNFQAMVVYRSDEVEEEMREGCAGIFAHPDLIIAMSPPVFHSGRSGGPEVAPVPKEAVHREGGLRLAARNSLDGDTVSLEMSTICKFSALGLT
jgi:hypothetical protein